MGVQTLETYRSQEFQYRTQDERTSQASALHHSVYSIALHQDVEVCEMDFQEVPSTEDPRTAFASCPQMDPAQSSSKVTQEVRAEPGFRAKWALGDSKLLSHETLGLHVLSTTHF